MKILILSLLILLMGYVDAYASTNSADLCQLKIDRLVEALRHDEVGKIEILQVPADEERRTLITSQMLEASFDFKIIISNISESHYKTELQDALKSTRAQPKEEVQGLLKKEDEWFGPDIRWGIIFYGPDGKRLNALFFNAHGNQGSLDSVPVHFEGELPKWLKEAFSGVFR